MSHPCNSIQGRIGRQGLSDLAESRSTQLGKGCTGQLMLDLWLHRMSLLDTLRGLDSQRRSRIREGKFELWWSQLGNTDQPSRHCS